MINHQVYNGFKADIFSLGVILFKLLNNKFPFKIANIKDKLYNLIFKQNFNNYWNKLQSFGLILLHYLKIYMKE